MKSQHCRVTYVTYVSYDIAQVSSQVCHVTYLMYDISRHRSVMGRVYRMICYCLSVRDCFLFIAYVSSQICHVACVSEDILVLICP